MWEQVKNFLFSYKVTAKDNTFIKSKGPSTTSVSFKFVPVIFVSGHSSLVFHLI